MDIQLEVFDESVDESGRIDEPYLCFDVGAGNPGIERDRIHKAVSRHTEKELVHRDYIPYYGKSFLRKSRFLL